MIIVYCSLYNVIVFLLFIGRRLDCISKRRPIGANSAASASESDSPSIVLELGRFSHHKLAVDLLSDCSILILLHNCQQNLIALFVAVHVENGVTI